MATSNAAGTPGLSDGRSRPGQPISPRQAIAPDLTLRQIVAAWPACASLLERYPHARWGGRWSLQELGPFASDAGVEVSSLVRELSAAAGSPVAERARPPAAGSPMPLIFVAIVVGWTLGAGWGVGLLLRIAYGADFAAVPGASVHVHGLAQLWGWMALFIFAVGSHLLRQNTRRPSPRWLDAAAGAAVVVALGLFFAGLYPAARAALPWAPAAASTLLALAAASFAVSAVWSLVGRQRRPEPWHAFVLASVAWLLVWAGSDLAVRLGQSDPAPPAAARELLITLPVLGFATNAIYGFGIRLIPGLLNIGRLRPRCFLAALLTHNAGLSLFLAPAEPWPTAGAALMLAGAASYLAGLDGLRAKRSRPLHGVDPRGHVLIRVAFFWLVVGLAMVLAERIAGGLPHAYGGAWRHALTVGFITTIILGVAQRLVPIFARRPLASARLMLVGAGLIIVGNAGRVALELATLGGAAWTYRLMGATGLLELTALALFAVNVALTARRPRPHRRGDPLTPDTLVREAINARPELQQRLRDAGVTMLDDSPFVAPSMTLGAMALAWGRSPEDLIARLEAGEEGLATEREILNEPRGSIE